MKQGKIKTDEERINAIGEFSKDYLSIDKDRLSLFVVNFLQTNGIEPTFDKIVIASFKLFPKKFSLLGFPEYPDALTVHYCLYMHNTKIKGWLSGNVQTGFNLTEKGKYFFEETKKILNFIIKHTKQYGTTPRRKELTFINLLKKTKAYKKYLQNKKEEITNDEILESLRVTSFNPKERIKKHLEKYIEYSNRINDSESTGFLNFIKKRLGENKNVDA